jgi:hypothetical protein
LPYRDATDCRTKIYSNGKFEVACKDNSWVAAGRYDYDGKRLTLNYDWLTHRGEMVKNPQPVHYTIEGAGNRIGLTSSEGATYVWNRMTHD